jgi:homoserine dehydrogenase
MEFYMTHYKLALLGFGNVGRALAELLMRKEAELKNEHDITFTVTGIATGNHGTITCKTGIDLAKALEVIKQGGRLDDLPKVNRVDDKLEFVKTCNADVLFENSPVNHANGQPAISYIKQALLCHMHVATANKGPVVHAYRELTDLAQAQMRRFLFESTVMDGAPIFSLFRSALPAAKIKSFRGVLNSTTNLILTRMESDESFEDAVRYAQSIGIAETDPSGDVDGWDAAIKVAALVTVLMGIPFKPQQVDREGIRHLTPEQIQNAVKENKRWKLVCSAQRDGDTIHARVQPEIVSASSQLYNIDGTTSIVEFETDVLGNLSLCETNPGPQTTAYGLLADFINAVNPQ